MKKSKSERKIHHTHSHRVMRALDSCIYISFFTSCKTLNCERRAREMNQIAYIVGNNYCYAIRCRRRRRRFFSLSFFFDIEYYKAFVRTLITNLFLLFVNGKLNEKSKLLRCTSCSVCIFFTLFFQFYFIYYFCVVSRPTHCVETHTQTPGSLVAQTQTHTPTHCVFHSFSSCACALVNSFCSAHEHYCHE